MRLQRGKAARQRKAQPKEENNNNDDEEDEACSCSTFPPKLGLRLVISLLLILVVMLKAFEFRVDAVLETMVQLGGLHVKKISNDTTANNTKGAAMIAFVGPATKAEKPTTTTAVETAPTKNPLHDQTLNWDASVKRFWMSRDSSANDANLSRPPAQLLLTNYGYNHPNQTFGLSVARTMRDRALMEGVINHPWFNPVDWKELNQALNNSNSIHLDDPNLRFYVFPDVATCIERSWPVYGGSPKANMDSAGNRTLRGKECYYGHCSAMDRILNSPLFGRKQNVHLVFFECNRWGPERKHLRHRNGGRQDIILFATISALIRNINQGLDQGLPPPPGKRANLTVVQRQAIVRALCNNPDDYTRNINNSRPFFFTFVGNLHRNGKHRRADPRFHARSDMIPFHNKDEGVLIMEGKDFAKLMPNVTFEALLASSQFSAAPRGHSKFSYRFSEIMSAGAIPVVLADDWLWPFRPELVDWGKCAVILGERQANETVPILRNITSEEACQRRQACWSIYEQYMETDNKVVAGLLEGWERIFSNGGKTLPLAGVHCENGDPRCNFT